MSITIDNIAEKIFSKNIDKQEALLRFESLSEAEKNQLVSQLKFKISDNVNVEASQPLFFQESWQEQSLTTVESKPDNKQYIVFTDKELQERIVSGDGSELFTNSITVNQADSFQEISARSFNCCFNNLTDIHKVLNCNAIDANAPVSIIYTWGKGKGEAGVHALFSLFKVINESTRLVTHVTLIGEYDPSLMDTCWDYSWIGFERSLKLVLPKLKISLLYTNSSTCTSQQLLDATKRSGVTWYNNDKRYVLFSKRSDISKTTQTDILKQNGSYLITGGCGALGLKIARYLAEKYKAKLLLLGRKPLSSSIQEKIDSLKQAGAQEVVYQSVDICNKASVKSWAKKIPFSLSGVIHAAGVESTQVFYEKSIADINEVLQPKSIGTLLLDEVLVEHSLDFVCYFSSSSALLGDLGSCDYSLANRFQMAYAHYRQQSRQGKDKTIVINWPFWQEGGMIMGDSEQTAFYLKSSGQDPLDTATGINIWHDIINNNEVQTLVMLGKPSRIEKYLNRIYETEQISQVQTIMQISHSYAGKGWKSQYQELTLKQCVISDVRQIISELSKITLNRLDNTTNLADYGFDSIILTELAKELSAHFVLEVTPALFYNYATIERLCDYFVQDHELHMQEFYRRSQTDSSQNDSIAAARPTNIQPLSRNKPANNWLSTKVRRSFAGRDNREPIAIIGMSGRFPQARTVDQFWTILAEGKSGINEIPLSRWDWRDYFTAPGDKTNKISTNRGGFIDGIDEFDPLFFGISPQEAESMDPDERLLLIEAYNAIEDAGLDPLSLKGSKVGVFVGMEESQHDLLSSKQGYANSGNAMISSRISYNLDLHGPVIATNTACSSGLVALHQGTMSLRQGECQAALVAGIALIPSPISYLIMSQAGMLSPDGQSFSLANKANGLGVGEAVVVLMLKPLSAALAEGHNIYGTIKASGINFDGKTNGITAPNGQMQAELIESIYTEYNVNVRNITHVVTHSTGTKLGDSVEINALNRAFKNLRNKQKSDKDQKTNCALTSCKSNVGHTLAASGLVSVVSLLKGMEHHKIPASLNCEEANNYAMWKDSPFYINKEIREWEKSPDQLYMGAVSSFGRSGTNAHVVIEEYVPSTGTKPEFSTNGHHKKVIIVLSARNSDQLHQKACDLLSFITKHKQDNPIEGQQTNSSGKIDLQSLAYTLQVGRSAMVERLGFVADSVDQLAEKIQAYINGELHIEDMYQGNIIENKEGLSIISQDDDLKKTIIDKWIAGNKLSKLLDIWIKGLDIDWNNLYGNVKPKRMSLPAYPFAREKYWILENEKIEIAGSTSEALQPIHAAIQAEWIFSTNGSDGKHIDSMKPAEKMELFLKQEIAQQLQIPVQKIAIEKSFFDLGLDSISITNIIGKTNHLLEGNLLPSVVFEYINIKKLAEFLVTSFSEKIKKIVVTTQKQKVKQDKQVTKAEKKDIPQNLDNVKPGAPKKQSNPVLSSESVKPTGSIWTKVMNQESATTSYNILVPMQTEGNKIPVFGMTGVGGNVLCLQPLSQALGNTQPFYGLQAVGIDGKTPPLDSVEKIAKVNIDAIKTAQKTGPYALFGYSFGGVVAFEMARILLEQKEKISSLILLDTLCPILDKTDEVNHIVDLYKTLSQTTGVNINLDVETLKQTSGKDRMEYLYNVSKKSELNISKEQFITFYSLSMANRNCSQAYTPSKLLHKIDVSLYRATETYADMPEDYGWNQFLLNKVQITDIKTNHFSIIDNGPIQVVAKEIMGRN